MTRYNEAVRIAQLISKLLRDAISPEEEKELASRLQSNGLDTQELLRRFIDQDFSMSEDQGDKEMEDAVWNAVKGRMGIPARRFRLRRTLQFAAAAAVAAVGIFVISYLAGTKNHTQEVSTIQLAVYEPTLEFPGGEVLTFSADTEIGEIISERKDTKPQEPANLIISIPKGMMYTFTMNDGTRVHLFPETRLEFPRSFDGTQRSVVLDGEAFFEVAHNESKPFTVNTTGASVRVLGTSFNVRAYSSQYTVETALVSGSVGVNGHIIEPGQLAVVTKSEGKLDIIPVSGETYRERAQGVWVFDYLPLETIMQELGRWFDFDHEYADNSLMEKRFRFKLPSTSGFSRITELMEMTGELKFDITGNNIVISAGK